MWKHLERELACSFIHLVCKSLWKRKLLIPLCCLFTLFEAYYIYILVPFYYFVQTYFEGTHGWVTFSKYNYANNLYVWSAIQIPSHSDAKMSRAGVK